MELPQNFVSKTVHMFGTYHVTPAETTSRSNGRFLFSTKILDASTSTVHQIKGLVSCLVSLGIPGRHLVDRELFLVKPLKVVDPLNALNVKSTYTTLLNGRVASSPSYYLSTLQGHETHDRVTYR